MVRIPCVISPETLAPSLRATMKRLTAEWFCTYKMLSMWATRWWRGTVYTDVVILAVAAIVEIDIQELWVAFGTGRHFKYIPNWPWQVSISSYHVYGVWYGIILWHKGKEVSMGNLESIWRRYSNFPGSVLRPSRNNWWQCCRAGALHHLADRTSDLTNIDELERKEEKENDGCHPTNTRCVGAAHQEGSLTGGHCWGQATAVVQKLPSPADWGWAEPPKWKPLWTTLPEDSTSSRELISRGYKQGCRGRSMCNKSALKCTALC